MEGRFMAAVIVLAMAALLHSTAAETHIVGDSLGWAIPPAGAAAYVNWAAANNFTVGDILVFNFAEGRHDVVEVSKSAFQNCNATSPISTHTTAPTNITLASAGEHFFICGFSGHCDAGQKLAINVTTGASSPAPSPSTPSPASSPTPTPSTSAAPSPSTTPSPPSPTTPTTTPPSPETAPPPPNSATSLGVTGFFTAVLSLAIALMF